MTPILLVLALPVVVLAIHDVLRRATLRRLAIRNAVRRPGEAVLVLIGSLLGTAIITASFVVGDTLDASLRDAARTRLGPTDVVVRVAGFDGVPAVERAVGLGVEGTDGILRIVSAPAAALAPGDDPRAEPDAGLIEVDFDAARRFGGDTGATGFAGAGASPVAGEAVAGEALADSLGIGPGDRVEVHAYGTSRAFAVREIVPRLGVAGLSVAGSDSANLFVPPGTIAAMAGPAGRGGDPSGAARPAVQILLSAPGGVFEGGARSGPIAAELERRLAGLPDVDVQEWKHDLLDRAERAGSSFTALFGGIGSFSVIAGVLLLVNVFVMLADERKSELGMLRAIGLRRNHLVRAFGLEGVAYSLVASVLGALAGIAMGRVIVVVAGGFFGGGGDDPLSIRFAAEPSAVVGGFLIGASISVLTVWLASTRIGRLNVIRAIRDLPEPVLQRERLRTLVLGAVGVLIGGAMFATGATREDAWFPALTGVPLAAFSSIPLLRRLVPRRVVVTGACIVSLLWSVVAFEVMSKAFDDVDIPTFVVMGVMLVASAVTLLATNADLSVHLIDRLSGSRTLAARLGLAYPLARRFRTSMLLGMYALVIFTLTMLSVFSDLFSQQAPKFTEELRAGYDLVVDSNPGNPVPAATLEAQPEVTSAAPLVRGFPEFSHARHREPDHWALTGFDERFLAHGEPVLEERGARFATDRAAWEAVLADPGLVIVSDFFLEDGGGPPSASLEPGDTLVVHPPSTGAPRELEVVGIAGSDWVFNGAMVGAASASDLLGPSAVLNRAYVKVAPGLVLADVASNLNGRLLVHGADAESIASIVEDNLSDQEGFFTLMQGYLALGLVIGVLGLGVVMVRAVRERRRQIGMLRAMGFAGRTVRAAFLLEAVFIAGQGVVVGVALALLTSYQLITQSDAFGDDSLAFSVPWLSLVVVLIVTLAASLVAVLAPAVQASRIRPAVALRIAD